MNQQRVSDWLYDLLYGQGVKAALGQGGLEVFVEWAETAENNGVVSLADILAEWRQMEASGERVGREEEARADASRGQVLVHDSRGKRLGVPHRLSA